MNKEMLEKLNGGIKKGQIVILGAYRDNIRNKQMTEAEEIYKKLMEKYDDDLAKIQDHFKIKEGDYAVMDGDAHSIEAACKIVEVLPGNKIRIKFDGDVKEHHISDFNMYTREGSSELTVVKTVSGKILYLQMDRHFTTTVYSVNDEHGNNLFKDYSKSPCVDWLKEIKQIVHSAGETYDTYLYSIKNHAEFYDVIGIHD